MANLKMVRWVEGEKQYLIHHADMFCANCDEWRETLIQVDAFMGEDGVPEWDDTIGEAFCSVCEEEAWLFDSEEEAVQAARENYEADRADAIRKGEW